MALLILTTMTLNVSSPIIPRLSDKVQETLIIVKRGANELLIENEFIQKLVQAEQNNQPLQIKLGFDPTVPDLHLGHSVVLNKMRQLQNLGHTAIFLIGDFTAMIGDPSGRNTTRPALTREKIDINAKTYLTQANLILDSQKTKICYNTQWYNLLGSQEIIRLASYYTVARMLERDDFIKRFKKGIPIAMHEFLYPLIQGYDSVTLKIDLELGGTDQKFNLLIGRELQKKFGQKPQCILTMPILEGLYGIEKMSKSKNNYIGITEPANIMFSKIMSISDSMMWHYYELLSFYPLETIAKFKTEIKNGKNPRDIKIILAQEIVSRFHSKQAAENALEDFTCRMKGGIPNTITEIHLNHAAPLGIKQLLKITGLCTSTSQGLRMIEQRGVRINGAVISDKNLKIEAGVIILQVGKRKFARITLTESKKLNE